MQVAACVPWSDLDPDGIAVAHQRGALPPRLGAPGLAGVAALVDRTPIDPALVAALRAEQDAETGRPWRPLADPRARAVVTGQQPGCAGGTLLVLYKAATAVALARRLALVHDRPFVPVFWNATDDTDFDEIARVAWPDGDGVVWLEIPAVHRRAQGLVGDLPAVADVEASRAALALLGEPERRRLQAVLPAAAADHGDWVARFLRAVFPDLAVLDARSPALRRHAAPLFGRYLDLREPIEAELAAGARGVESAGFVPALAPELHRLALFLTGGGQRRKISEDISPVREALDRAPETVAPSVVLRPLVQDLLLPGVANVVGPAEVAYLLELRGLRPLLDVPELALVPRLAMTVVEPSAWGMARDLDLAAGDLLRDGDAALRAAARRRAAGDLEAVQGAFAAVHERLGPLAARAGGAPAGIERTLRRLGPVQAELEKQVEDAALRDLLAAHPALATLRTRLRPRGKPQERTWAALWLVARWGTATGERLVERAAAHLDAVAQGRLEHCIVLDAD